MGYLSKSIFQGFLGLLILKFLKSANSTLPHLHLFPSLFAPIHEVASRPYYRSFPDGTSSNCSLFLQSLLITPARIPVPLNVFPLHSRLTETWLSRVPYHHSLQNDAPINCWPHMGQWPHKILRELKNP